MPAIAIVEVRTSAPPRPHIAPTPTVLEPNDLGLDPIESRVN